MALFLPLFFRFSLGFVNVTTKSEHSDLKSPCCLSVSVLSPAALALFACYVLALLMLQPVKCCGPFY